MVKRKEILIFYIATILFVAFEMLLIFLRMYYIAALLPVGGIVIYMAIFALDYLMLLVVFCTPLSLKYHIPGLELGQIGVGMSMPTQPIMFGIMLLFFMHTAYTGYAKSNLRHPVSIIIIIGLLWILVTSCTSTMPFVSFKFLIERIWNVVTFYFLGIILFKTLKNMYSFMWLYIIPFAGIIVYTLIRHSHYHFAVKQANPTPQPFYNDHTAYGAMLAMFIPVLAGFVFTRRIGRVGRIAAFGFLCLFVIALFFSFSRAAWVSVVVAMLLLVLMLFRVKLKWILAGFFLGMAIFFTYQTKIIMQLQRNTTDVSQDYSKELQSISNISSDASNRERLNRWSCAYRMWCDKPVFGYGPGTYSFKYAPYQLSYMRTIISTNEGNGGNSHSEYLGPLAEEGVLGMLLVIAMAMSVIALAFRLAYNFKDRDMRILVISILLGLTTYFVHGFMNNFLDTDKASVPFWGFIGMLVAIDLTSKKEDFIEKKPKTVIAIPKN